MLQLKIFLSSPGDVANERNAARQVMEELSRGPLLKGRVAIDVIAWDDRAAPAPMEAAVTPQESVNRYTGMPADCDLTVVILWSRLGTVLPPHTRRDDGTRYESGTVWEYENARAAGRPVWIYRCTKTPTLAIDDPDLDEKRRQYQLVEKFFAQFKAADGSLSGGVNAYNDQKPFAGQFKKHLEAFINERLKFAAVGAHPAPEVAPLEPQTLTALAALRERVHKGDDWPLTSEDLHRILSHSPRSLDDYRLARIAEWSQAKYSIDKRFTPLTLLVDQGEEEQGVRWQAQPRTYDDLRELLSDVTEPALVVLGPPGCGKSTVLRRLELDMAVDALRASNAAAKVSLFLPLNSYGKQGDTPVSPRAWIEQQWRRRGASVASFDALLRQGKLLLLLDAVNEMPHAGAADYAERIKAWREFLTDLSRSAPGTRVVFSCRELDYSATLSTPELRVPHVRIERLGDTQVEQFLSLYNPEHGPRLWQELKGTPQLDLFRSPFYLRMLLAQAGGGAPLTGRAALFTGFVRQALLRELETEAPWVLPGALLDQRDHAQLVARRWRGAHDLPARGALIPALEKFAFDLQQSREGRELAQVRVSYDQAVAMLGQHADALLKAGTALQVLEQQFDDVYFTHQLLQEFFAARCLVARPDKPVTLARAAWRAGELMPAMETVLQNLALADPLPAAPATGWEETFVLAAAMALQPEIWLRALMHENLPLAGRCAAQPDVRISDNLRNDIRHALQARSRDPAADLRARIAAAHALGEVGDARFQRCKGPHGDYLLPPVITIAAGTYKIGSNERIEDDEAPAHALKLKAFALGQFPVTNAEYRCFIEAGGYDDEQWWQNAAAQRWRRGEGTAEGPKQRLREIRDWYQQDAQRLDELRRRNPLQADAVATYISMTDQHFEAQLDEWYPDGRQTQPAYWNDPAYNQALQPVVGITWHEATAYCAWLSAQTGTAYRLPSEAEWEAAARGAQARAFAWGRIFDVALCNAFESHVRRTTPVGVFPDGDTPEGLADITGNVWDWTSSLYRPYPYRTDDGREDIGNADDPRVLRGGSWYDLRGGCRCACRLWDVPGVRSDYIGFRVCVAPPII